MKTENVYHKWSTIISEKLHGNSEATFTDVELYEILKAIKDLTVVHHELDVEFIKENGFFEE